MEGYKRSNSTLSDSDTIVGEDSSSQCTPVAFNPISVESFNRYCRGRYVKNVATPYCVPPFCRPFSRGSVPNWTPHRHPEGVLYFMHEKHRIFTDAYMYNDAVLDKMNTCISQIIIRLGDKGFFASGAEEIDVVLDLAEDSDDMIKCGYYFVDHSMRSIFWMNFFDMDQLVAWKRVPGIDSASYVSELRDAIVDIATDALTSPTTTVAFALDDLLKMLTLTISMGGDVEGARPESYGVKIDQGLSLANSLGKGSWNKFSQSVKWQDMTLYASLILNANVGILAIPGSGNTSIALVSSYMSICFGLGSIILGLLLSRKDRLEAVDAVTATPAHSFKQQSLHALEARAFLFSLPYVFMVRFIFPIK
ncbi:hypothetical protein DFH09DRAFT_1343104 [Mycena vulgaris]|nr:hypothetical protein DFH09DRAFT_1343104 [Mycena vulgaris]